MPNILLIVVDELRYPMHFPEGVDSAAAFLEKYMPNVHSWLWKEGVKFSRYYTAAADCSPGRGTFVTGLYAQQTNLMLVRGTQHKKIEVPALHNIFPTYGKLLCEAGYDTPYIGKWHLSDAQSREGYLNDYGFEGLTIPDPNGVAGQGIGEAKGQIGDHHIALKAVEWLRAREGTAKPFCLTVGFINPHDKQWFWTGPEPSNAALAYASSGTKPFSGALETWYEEHRGSLPPDIPGEDDPPPCGYARPANWQSKTEMSEKGQPVLARVFSALTDFSCGGISDCADVATFGTQPSPLCEGWNAPFAPNWYWTKALDMYTQAMTNVDCEIGLLLDRIPPAMRDDMVIVFTSDHGEYASSHGLQGKGYTAYEETIRVPLIVRDFTGLFAQSTHIERTQLASSVDLLRLLVSLGYGNDQWMTGELWELYGRRADLLSIVRDHKAKGREFAAYSCDEGLIPPALNFANAAEHVGALIFENGKFTVFSRWAPFTRAVMPAEHFYYDYSTEKGRLELESSTPPQSPWDLVEKLQLELRAPLPERYRVAQEEALLQYWTYLALVDALAKGAVIFSRPESSIVTSSPFDTMYIPTVNAPQEIPAAP